MNDSNRTRGPATARDAATLVCCPVCRGDLVYPTFWSQSGRTTWRLELRCPDCETQREVEVDGDAARALNVLLYEGTEQMERALDALSRDRVAEEEKAGAAFIAALRRDLILPMDF